MIFANLALQPGDEAGRLRALGLPVCSSHSTLRPPHLAQPCGAFDGCRCRVYADRPHYCREFECALLHSVKAGRTDHGAAVRIIRTARERAEKVRRLLHALGDTDEQLPLSARFRRTGKRLKEHELSEDDAEAYGQLTLAVHDLNLLLSEAFYPGSTRHRSRSVGAVAVSVVAATVLLLLAAAGSVLGDQVELQNGDRYVGEVLSLNAKTVVLQSEVLGTLRLPRNKVAVITLGPLRPANSPALRSPTNSDAAASAAPPARTASNATPTRSASARSSSASTSGRGRSRCASRTARARRPTW